MLPTEAPELGHADDERQCGTLTDAGHAEHQIQAVAEIVMSAQTRDDPMQLGPATCLEAGNIGHDNAPQPRIFNVLEPDFQAGDVFFDLLNEGQMLRKLGQSRIGCNARSLHDGRASSDQNRIKLVVLGAAEMDPRVLKDPGFTHIRHNSEAPLTQISHNAAFVATARFDPNSGNLSLAKFCRQVPPAGRSIVDLPTFCPAMNGHIKLGFGCIDCCRCDNLRHLHRPCLVEANQAVPATIRVR